MHNAIETLEKYVNLPSGSYDKADAQALAEVLAGDFSSLGMTVELIPGDSFGPALSARWGSGPKQLLLMGHYDTVFPHDLCRAFSRTGGIAHGSGIGDMKGGIAVMLCALEETLPSLDRQACGIRVLLNADEETGSVESRGHILAAAQESFAALSFEPGGTGRLTCERKGVTNFELTCQGIGGHAGAFYKQGASAIQALSDCICALYALRDDARDISLNIGVIQGGTAENVIADTASARGEFRSFDPDDMAGMEEKIRLVCAQNAVPGTAVSVRFGASHPACKLTEPSRTLYSRAAEIALSQGRELPLERTGGAGDISFAAQAGIAVLDGLGLEGGGFHTRDEYADIGKMPLNIQLASRLMLQLLH